MSSTEKNTMIGIFVLIIIVFCLYPGIVTKLYGSIFGRICLIAILICISFKNLTLGLLVALSIISGLNQSSPFVKAEGFTVGDDNVNAGTKIVLTDAEISKINDAKSNINNNPNVSELKAKIADGVDIETIKTAIMPKDSKTIQLDPNVMKNEDVTASSTSMLKQSSLTEGFSFASPV
jgi:hypothetical protein